MVNLSHPGTAAYPYLAPSGMEKLRATHDNQVPLRVGGKLVAAKTRGTC